MLNMWKIHFHISADSITHLYINIYHDMVIKAMLGVILKCFNFLCVFVFMWKIHFCISAEFVYIRKYNYLKLWSRLRVINSHGVANLPIFSLTTEVFWRRGFHTSSRCCRSADRTTCPVFIRSHLPLFLIWSVSHMERGPSWTSARCL